VPRVIEFSRGQRSVVQQYEHGTGIITTVVDPS